MTKEDILRLAREAGFDEWAGTDDVHFLAVIERFANLVAAAERDRLRENMRNTDQALDPRAFTSVKRVAVGNPRLRSSHPRTR